MKKRTFIISLTILLVLSLVWAVGMVMGKYTSTFSVGKIAFKTTDYQTYTYAVLDNDVNTNTKTALSIRNRQAVIVDGGKIGRTAGTNYLVDKDGTYELGDNGVVYALPDSYFKIENTVPSGAITGQWKTGYQSNTDFEKSITSVMVADPIDLQGSLYCMFQQWLAVESIDLVNANFSTVTNMSCMFDYCENMTSVTFAKAVNTRNVTTMEKLFYGCKLLTNLDLSGFNTINVANMSLMFFECSKLETIDVSEFDVKNVTTMSAMFSGCHRLKNLDISHFVTTSKLENLGQMFLTCRTLESVDLSGFDTSNVTDMNNMFRQCWALTELDVSNFDTRNVTNMWGMFYVGEYGTAKLTTIYVSDKFVTDKVADGFNSSQVFGDSPSLKGGNGTQFSGGVKDKTYAVIDGANGQKGYFTLKNSTTPSPATLSVTVDASVAVGCTVPTWNYLNKDTVITLNTPVEGLTQVVLTCGEQTATATVTNGTIIIPAEFVTDGAAITISAVSATPATPSEDTTGNEENNTTEPEANGGGTETASNEQESSASEETTSPENVSTDPVLPPSEGSEDAENGTEQTEGQQDQE